MTSFKDHFSKQSELYLKYRPHYPPELFLFLSSLTDANELAWDCGTGNGQAAIGLTPFYKSVIATDPSEQQIKNFIPNDKVSYRIEKAEHTSINTNSVDLITIANALHWFDFNLFYKEAHRVSKNAAIIAAWAYGVPFVSYEIDKVIKHYHDHILNNYWLAENRLVEMEYETVPFPFQAIQTPEFYCKKFMNLNDYISYLNTWSGTQRFIDKNKINPTRSLYTDLVEVWGNVMDEKMISWKLILKVGRI